VATSSGFGWRIVAELGGDIKRNTHVDLDFLLNLPEIDLETLVVCIRERFDQLGKQAL